MVMTPEERRIARRKAQQKWNAKHPGWGPLHGRRQSAVRRATLAALKAAPCMDCGMVFPPECMDFDHVRGEKLFNVGEFRFTMSVLLEEIAKCELVCANCHRIRTAARR